MAEQELQTINGWVAKVDNRLEKLGESVEALRLSIVKLEIALEQMVKGQQQYLTSSSFDHQKVVKDISDIDDRLRDLKRISLERQEIVNQSVVYMRKVDELEANLRRVWKSLAWTGGILATIGAAVIIKWIEMVYFRPQLYEHAKQVLASLIGGN